MYDTPCGGGSRSVEFGEYWIFVFLRAICYAQYGYLKGIRYEDHEILWNDSAGSYVRVFKY